MTMIKKASEIVAAERAASGAEPVPTTSQYGIKETSEALRFVLLLVNGGVRIRRISTQQLVSYFGQILPHAIPALDRIEDVPKELADMDDGELKVLLDTARAVLDLRPLGDDDTLFDTPPAKRGIAETSDVVNFIAALGRNVIEYKSAPVSRIFDALTTIAPKAISAIAGIGDVPAEMSDMDEDEAVTLVRVFARELEITSDALETNVENGFRVVVDLNQAYNALVSHLKNRAADDVTIKEMVIAGLRIVGDLAIFFRGIREAKGINPVA